jgi:predicted phosphodiesterase
MNSLEQARRVAVIADIHGNAPALAAVLEEVEAAEPDLVVSLGDTTWGVQPEETRGLLEAITLPAIFVAGNGERALRELHEGRPAESREAWIRDQHSERTYAFLDTFVVSAVIDVKGLGPVRFCHGSPRSDIELVTPETPLERMKELMSGVPERVLVSGHTHLQFDRRVDGIRSINPGSVGMPYHELDGAWAFWAVLGSEVELKRSAYDVQETVRAYQASGDPLTKEMIDVLLSPFTPAQVEEVARTVAFRE